MMRNRDLSRNVVLNILFFATFLIHFLWMIYVANIDEMEFVQRIENLLSTVYSSVGFEWNGRGAYVVAAGLFSSVGVNGLRRFLEGVFFGWPQFKKHDKYSVKKAIFSVLVYGAIIYFSIGFFGEKYSAREIDSINLIMVTVSTYIVGLFVDLVDDLVSGFYCMFYGD